MPGSSQREARPSELTYRAKPAAPWASELRRWPCRGWSHTRPRCSPPWRSLAQAACGAAFLAKSAEGNSEPELTQREWRSDTALQHHLPSTCCSSGVHFLVGTGAVSAWEDAVHTCTCPLLDTCQPCSLVTPHPQRLGWGLRPGKGSRRGQPYVHNNTPKLRTHRETGSIQCWISTGLTGALG